MDIMESRKKGKAFKHIGKMPHTQIQQKQATHE
jgi:hypothetical protein